MDYETEYNNRARVSDSADILASWGVRSERTRGRAVAADLGLPFGPAPRQRLDILWPDATRAAPVVLFLHGGYWQALHPRDLSFVAEGLNARGVAVALPGYDLAPDVPLDTILSQARAAAAHLFQLIHRRFVVSGHSAGGHLAAALTVTAWTEVDPRLPDDMTPYGLGVSGLYDLAPLVQTSLNEKLNLSEEEARRLSPVFWQVPAGRVFETFTGGLESAEYLRQGRDLAHAWTQRGVRASAHVVEGANHFTVLDHVADPDSILVTRLAHLATAVAALD